jgi:DNA-binding NtrC family response regulator
MAGSIKSGTKKGISPFSAFERAVVLGNGPVLRIEDLPGRIAAAEVQISTDVLSYREAMEARRREIVLTALSQSNGNRTAAARALGLHEKYFLRLIKTLGIN